MRPLSAEAAMLGEVESMPEDLELPAIGNPFAKRSTTIQPGGKMRPSSYYTANEIKQSKRNRCVLLCCCVHACVCWGRGLGCMWLRFVRQMNEIIPIDIVRAMRKVVRVCLWGHRMSLCRKMMEKRGMLNRGETPSAQLFAISEQAEIRYTNNGLLYEVPADEVGPTPRADSSTGGEAEGEADAEIAQCGAPPHE